MWEFKSHKTKAKFKALNIRNLKLLLKIRNYDRMKFELFPFNAQVVNKSSYYFGQIKELSQLMSSMKRHILSTREVERTISSSLHH